MAVREGGSEKVGPCAACGAEEEDVHFFERDRKIGTEDEN